MPAIAHAAGLQRPTVDDWAESTAACRGWSTCCPTGRSNHPTVRVFLAGGVPEVMLHLRELGLLNLDVLTVSGQHAGRCARLVGAAASAASGCVSCCEIATASIPTT